MTSRFDRLREYFAGRWSEAEEREKRLMEQVKLLYDTIEDWHYHLVPNGDPEVIVFRYWLKSGPGGMRRAILIRLDVPSLRSCMDGTDVEVTLGGNVVGERTGYGYDGLMDILESVGPPYLFEKSESNT